MFIKHLTKSKFRHKDFEQIHFKTFAFNKTKALIIIQNKLNLLKTITHKP